MTEVQRLTRTVGYELKRAQHSHRRAMDRAMHESGMTVAQYGALHMLSDAGPMSGASLARRCFVTPQSMNTVVQQLEAMGLLHRSPHPQHGRVLQLRITAGGLAAVEHSEHIVDRVNARMLSRLDDGQRRRLLSLLSLCADSVSGRARPAGPAVAVRHHSLAGD
jgi:DNA-binding MarR family transcriptional regulator